MANTQLPKKVLGLILFSLLFFVLCACSNADKTTNSNTSAAHEEQTSEILPSTDEQTYVRSILGDLFVTDGHFIYFANESSGGRLARAKVDMSDYEILDNSECYWLYLYDNYIYYNLFLENGATVIAKIRVDGKEKQILAQGMLLGGSESYLFFSDDAGLNRMNHDGTDAQMIFSSDVIYNNHVFTDQYIYMSDLSDAPSHGLYRVNTDGKALEKLSDDRADKINLINDKLFYGSGKLISINSDGSDKKVISEEIIIDIVLSKDWIYYIQQEFNAADGGYYSSICKMRYDGTERTVLYTCPVIGRDVLSLSVVAEHIFFKELQPTPSQETQNPYEPQFYRMECDGSNLASVSW